MGNEVSIRPAQLDDLPILLEFEQGIIEAERPFDDDIQEQANYYDLRALIESPEAQVLIADLEGELVGSGHVHIKPSKHYLTHQWHAYLGFMYVKPAFRGQGIVQSIIQSLIDWGTDRAINNIYLDVYALNDAAIRAYRKLGFTESLLEMKLKIDQ